MTPACDEEGSCKIPCDRETQTAMLNPLEAGQGTANLPDLPHGAAQENHFQAVVVIQVDMCRRNDHFVVFVLEIGEMILQFPFVVVVHQRQDAVCLRTIILRPFIHKAGANEIPDRLRSIAITGPGDEAIEFLDEAGLDRNAETQ